MANINTPIGARIRGALASSDFNPLIHEYIIPASDTDDFFVNDFVKTNDTSEDGVPIIVKAAAQDAIRGIIVSFKSDDPQETIVYGKANTRRVAYVCDDPYIEFEIQVTGTVVSTDIGKNADLLVASGDTNTGISDTQLDRSTLTINDAQIKILRIIEEPGAELGTFTNVKAMILKHELGRNPDELLLDQLNTYYVCKNGRNTNTGKSISDPFLTIAKAFTTIAALTPSTTNRFRIDVLDGNEYDEGPLAIPAYTFLNAPAANLKINFTLDDRSHIKCKNLENSTSGSGLLLLDEANSSAFVEVLETLTIPDGGKGISAELGELHINCRDVYQGIEGVAGSALLGNETLGTVYFTSTGKITLNNSLIDNTTAGTFYIDFNKISIATGTLSILLHTVAGSTMRLNGGDITTEAGATTVTLINSNTGGDVQIKMDSLTLDTAGSKVANITSSANVRIICNEMDVNTVSVVTNSSTMQIITADDGGDTKLSNNGGNVQISSEATESIILQNGNDEIFASQTGGFPKWTSTPLVVARDNASATNVTGDGTEFVLAYEDIVTNVGSDWSGAAFTAPVAGHYLFITTVQYLDLAAAHTGLVLRYFATSLTSNLIELNPGAIRVPANSLTLTASIIAPMAATEVGEFRTTVTGSTKTVDIGIATTKIEIYLLTAS